MAAERCILLPALFSVFFFTSCSKKPETATTVSYLTRLQAYAAVLDTVIGGAGDTRNVVVPASAAYPVGTLLVAGGGAVDSCSISPGSFLSVDPAVEWTPPLASDSQFSFDFAVPAAVLAGLAGANAKVTNGSGASLAFEGLTQHAALLVPFEKDLADDPCHTKISALLAGGKTVTIIRGYLIGKESFDFTQGVSASAGATVKSVGGFNISFSNGIADSMVETTPTEHFLITYNLAPTTVSPHRVGGASAPAPSGDTNAPLMSAASPSRVTAAPNERIAPSAAVVSLLQESLNLRKP